ncbi:MAG: hypothetical protein ACRCZF_06015 [Gemmataceae bacterium]
MGVQREIQAIQVPLEWDRLAETLQALGFPMQVRMVDGLPAFPDEVPEPGWKELRVAIGGGMLTLRYATLTTMQVVGWSNLDQTMQKALDCLTATIAEQTRGTVQTHV